MAVNKQAILDAVYQGAGQAAINPIPPTMWSYNTAIKDDPYDPEAAKKMLADAGVTRSLDEDLGDARVAAPTIRMRSAWPSSSRPTTRRSA